MKNLDKQLKNVFTETDKSQWSLVKFGDIVREVKETSSDPESEGIERVVGLEHLTPLDIHIKDWKTIAEGTTFTRVFRKGQVLFGRRRAYQRKAALAEFDGLCSGDIIVMDAIKEKLDPDLLPFLVHSDKFFEWAVSTSAGSLSPRTKFKHLGELELNIPTLKVQARLAELLWLIQNYIDAATEAQAVAKKTYITIINEISNSKKTSDIVQLAEIAEVLDNLRKPLNQAARSKMKGDIPYYGSNGLVDYVNDYIFDGDYVLVAEDGGYFAEFYEKPIAYLVSGKSWVNNHAHVIKSKDQGSLDWIFYSLVHKDINRYIQGTTRTKLNKSDLVKLEIWWPSNQIRESYISRIRATEETQKNLDDLVKNLKRMQQKIIQQMI